VKSGEVGLTKTSRVVSPARRWGLTFSGVILVFKNKWKNVRGEKRGEKNFCGDGPTLSKTSLLADVTGVLQQELIHSSSSPFSGGSLSCKKKRSQAEDRQLPKKKKISAGCKLTCSFIPPGTFQRRGDDYAKARQNLIATCVR